MIFGSYNDEDGAPMDYYIMPLPTCEIDHQRGFWAIFE